MNLFGQESKTIKIGIFIFNHIDVLKFCTLVSIRINCSWLITKMHWNWKQIADSVDRLMVLNHLLRDKIVVKYVKNMFCSLFQFFPCVTYCFSCCCLQPFYSWHKYIHWIYSDYYEHPTVQLPLQCCPLSSVVTAWVIMLL